jgi:hypothetical protein
MEEALQKLKPEQLKKWKREQQSSPILPVSLDVNCPNRECSRSLVGSELKWVHVFNQETAWARLTCKNCDNAVYFLLFDEEPQTPSESRALTIYIDPSPAPDVRLPEGVNWAKLFKRFVDVLEQAVRAEEQDLNEISGMGYRKAFEILVKDHAIRKHPKDKKLIEEMFLNTCIQTYITDPRILETAERTVWLGNDHSHYFKRHANKDLDDLKRLLNQALHYIAIEMLNDRDRKTIQKK